MGPYNAGFIWIWTPMSYSDGKDASGRQTRVVRSPTMRTSLEFPVGIAAGMHYCKLLSPARVMEWVYVDELQKYYSINKTMTECTCMYGSFLLLCYDAIILC